MISLLLTAACLQAPAYLLIGPGEKTPAHGQVDTARVSDLAGAALLAGVDLSQNAPAYIRSDGYPGLNPGFSIYIFGACPDPTAADQLAIALGATLDGIYVRKIDDDRGLPACPRISDMAQIRSRATEHLAKLPRVDAVTACLAVYGYGCNRLLAQGSNDSFEGRCSEVVHDGERDVEISDGGIGALCILFLATSGNIYREQVVVLIKTGDGRILPVDVLFAQHVDNGTDYGMGGGYRIAERSPRGQLCILQETWSQPGFHEGAKRSGSRRCYRTVKSARDWRNIGANSPSK